MALKNSITNEYLKVNQMTENLVSFDLYKDKKHRQDGDTKYMIHLDCSEYISNGSEYLETLPDNRKSILDNTKTAGYNALKDLPAYSDFIDD